MAELSKTYDPKSVEPKWYARWIDNRDFQADPSSPKPAFSIVIPPPNITGILTLGHVLNNTIQDILARRARMQGFEVLWLPGMDHAGVGTQTAVEKHLRKTEKKTRHDLGREEFLRRVREWQEKHGGIIIEQLKRLGCSCDWSRQRYTLDDEYVRAVLKVFVDLYKKGLIYRGRRMINWDPAAQTALSEEEVINKPQKGNLYYVRYEIVEEPGRFLEVATTRPETIMADTAIAVNPKDKRYVDLIGKHTWRPLAREKLPIITDEAIDLEFGTGVLKVTPGHDKMDFEIGQRHKLPVLDILTPDGRINCSAVPELHGLDRFEARTKAAKLLKERELLSKVEPYENSVGFSERSDVAIEPRISEQWFLRYPKTKEALAVVRDHLIRFFPAHWEKVYAQWLENIQDWCISRQVWWGHRIPAWYRVAEASRLQSGEEVARASRLQSEEGVAQASRLQSGEGVAQASRLQSGEGKPEAYPTFSGFDCYAEVDISRRHLPHWQQSGKTYFVTFRLADSIPAAKLSKLEHEREAWLKVNPEPWTEGQRRMYYEHFSVKLDAWLDTGSGSCVLRDDRAAKIVADALQHFDGDRYDLGAWVVMPNHVHVIVAPRENYKMSDILHSWKSFTAHEINKLLGEKGELWQHESYDHIIRNEQALFKVREYIEQNPDKAGIRVAQASRLRPTEERKPEAYATISLQPTEERKPETYATISLQPTEERKPEAYATIRVQIESPGEGWTQDSDTLDTWFSSWLWAYETMDEETRKKFYPTSVLVTAPDIIFFWVARMIIAGLEFKPGQSDRIEDNIPFRDVFFTGLIRDNKGRKMSKSLGNSPDPLDLIDKYGADGLRFGLMRIAPSGQDIRFDERQIEEGRNFATKLWNAARFRQMHGPSEAAPKIDPATAGSIFAIEVLARLNETIDAVENAYREYRFNEVAQRLYDFFWSDYCDWFVEASKTEIFGADEARKKSALAVMDVVLSGVLRLLHPFMPHITEELWSLLGFGKGSIQFASPPERIGLDDVDLAKKRKLVSSIYDVVQAGRNLRAEAKIPSNKKTSFVLRANSTETEDELPTVARLLNADDVKLDRQYKAAAGAPMAVTSLGEIFLIISGGDKAAESERLDKEIAKLEEELQKAEQKLKSKSFVDRAPAAVVEEHRQRKKDFSEQLVKLKKAREGLN